MTDIITAVAVPWSDHNGALKYFRDCVLSDEVPSKVLTEDEPVKRVVHGLRQNYSFGEWGQWDWRTLVAAMSPEDRDRLFEGQPITAVAVERRPGSYDHHMAVAAKDNGWANFCAEIVDFSFRRGDGRTVLVHPRWRKKGTGFDALMKPLEPSNPVPIIPVSGRGNSDGKGTYRRITHLAYSPAEYSPVAAASGSSAVAAASSSASAAAAAPTFSAAATGYSAAAAANAASRSAEAEATARWS